MGLKEFRIVFDNPWSTYYPGQTVAGNIVLSLDGTKKIRGITVKVKGEAATCWATDKQELDNTGRYRDESQTMTAHENYFEMKYYLVGSASGSEIEIQAGEHKFPFTCTLSSNLPSSFESDYGHVRYTVKATLDRPWKFDQDCKAAFTVISPLDLNQEPSASDPIREEMSKTFCCLCCASQPLTVNFSAPLRGYVPGQSIPIKVNVENLSNVTVTRVRLILCKMVTFHASVPHHETKTEEIEVSEVSKGPVEANGAADYEQSLDIPPLAPSNLTHCGIIDLEYNLKVEACTGGSGSIFSCHFNLSKNILIFVGTIPLINYQIPSAPPSEETDYPTKPMEAGFVIQPLASNGQPISNIYPDLPPPSYLESVNGARSLRERDESTNVIGVMNQFAPRYPVYNFGAFK